MARNLPPEEKREAERMRRKAERVLNAELYGGGTEIIEARIPLISKAKKAERELIEDKYKEKLGSKEGFKKLYTDEEFKKLEGKIHRLFETLETQEFSWGALFEYLGDFWEKFEMVDECLPHDLIDRLMKRKYAMGPSMKVEQLEKSIEGLKGWKLEGIFRKITSRRKIRVWARDFAEEVGNLSEIREKGIKREGNEKGVELSKEAFFKIHVVLLLLQDLAQFVENLYDYDEGIKIEGKGRDRIGKGWKEGKLVVKGNAGREVGRRMRGGEIVIQGDARDVGAGMEGGEIVVEGDARDYAGDYMRGGEIVVEGDVDIAGLRMRGGVLICKGKVNRIGAAFTGPFQGGVILAEKGITGGINRFKKDGTYGAILAGGKEKKRYVKNGIYHFEDLKKARKVAELLGESEISLTDRPIEYKGPLDTENKTAEQIAKIILPRKVE